MRKWLLSTALAVLAACAGTPEAGPGAAPATRQVALDPVGVYDFNTTVEGTSVSGVVTITRGDDGRYGGTITSSVTDPMPIRSVTVTGTRVDVVADTPDGPLGFSMELAGQDFSGSWSLGTMSGTHTGRRRTP